MSKKRYSFTSPHVMWLSIIVGIIAIFSWFSSRYIIRPNFILYIIAGAALGYWLYFFMKGITANLQAPFPSHHVTKLITGGVYGKIRHPIYSSNIALTWGIFCTYPTIAVYVSAMWTTAILITWVYLEERALLKRFTKEYAEYQKKVPMLFPIKKK